MPPKKSKKRAVQFDTDEYVEADVGSPSTQPVSVPTNTTVSQLHTLYEQSLPPVRSLIQVPAPVSVPSNLIVEQTSEIDMDKVPELEDAEFSDDDLSVDGECDADEAEIHSLEAMGLPNMQETVSKSKRKRTQGVDHPLRMWLPHIDTYVNEMLRLEGRDVSATTACANPDCNALIVDSVPGFRCVDCQSVQLYCGPCLVTLHTRLPFHRVQKWNKFHFERIALKDLGLRIQLGHDDGSSCSNPQQAFNDDFTVIDSDGIHQVGMDYCGCTQSLPKTIQLLRSRFFPSTVVDPKTAATFRVLETFQMLSFTSKVSAYEYYQSILRRTDNTGADDIPDRYQVFMRIIREWRHIRLLKRMGRGHSDSGVHGTSEGECAVLCPACPIPGINLAPDWEDRPHSEQWLHSLFLGIDANFRLKRLNVSSEDRDPGLNHGYAYIVETSNFMKYLSEYDTQIPDDKSTCNNHDAIKSASMRGGNGTAATGLGSVECSRHDMKRPISVGDLQKGERYVNMDYMFLSSLRHSTTSLLVVSYDIACQWSRNLVGRCSIYPPNEISSNSSHITFLVPKFHLPAHITQCQLDYSFNLVPKVGRTDGESPERGWSVTNALASSTKEMGPGSRRDTLDDHFGDRNWNKSVHMDRAILRKSEEAIANRQEHVDAFIEFNAALPSDSTSAWKTLCQKWEADRSQENPFKNENTFISDSQVRLELAEEDAAAIASGTRPLIHEDVTPAMLVYQGLEIEDLQHRHTLDVSSIGPHSTDLQKAKIVERSNSLQRKIEAWSEVQHLYMPAISLIRARADSKGGGKPIAVEDISLFLPSSVLDIITCDPYILQYEWKLRYSHAQGALNDLRGLLLMRSLIFKSKERYSRGQRQQTRSMALIARVEAKIKFATARYRRIRRALAKLSAPLLESDWKLILRELNDTDIVGLTSTDSSDAEGRKALTWIWKVQGVDLSSDKSTQDALRIEWCRARARAHRWQEECLLLREEMERVLRFFEWQAQRWRKLALEHSCILSDLYDISETASALVARDILAREHTQQGKIAYAYRQVTLYDKLKVRFTETWKGLATRLGQMERAEATVMIEC